jgi:uncharacterized protein (DUF1015 family)
MATIRKFRALRPDPKEASLVAAVPYDVVSREEAQQLAANNPLSFLHVSRSEIDLPDEVDPYSEEVYQMAKENFERLKLNCPLVLEESPSLYVYRLRMGEHSQVGIAACCSLDEYDSDIIKKHERTRRDKEDDRTRHILALGAQTGPVFLTYRGRDEINRIVSEAMRAEPLYDFVAPDGIAHTIWRLDGAASDLLVEAFQDVPSLYIADGHHRAAAAARARAQLRCENPDHSGLEEYNFLLGVLFPANQLRILPYNRVVKELGMGHDEFLKAVSERFILSPGASPQPSRKGQMSMYLGGRWYLLEVPPGSVKTQDPISSLDVQILQYRLLEPILGIKDVRTDKRIDFVGGIRGTAELERIVDEGRAEVAFSMYPVTVEQLMRISDAGQIMPPKSTWFEPKLRDGLLIHLI